MKADPLSGCVRPLKLWSPMSGYSIPHRPLGRCEGFVNSFCYFFVVVCGLVAAPAVDVAAVVIKLKCQSQRGVNTAVQQQQRRQYKMPRLWRKWDNTVSPERRRERRTDSRQEHKRLSKWRRAKAHSLADQIAFCCTSPGKQ